jgi:hypothetical protein
MLRKQPISGFFLWNDLVVQARYSMEAFFVVLSAQIPSKFPTTSERFQLGWKRSDFAVIAKVQKQVRRCSQDHKS